MPNATNSKQEIASIFEETQKRLEKLNLYNKSVSNEMENQTEILAKQFALENKFNPFLMKSSHQKDAREINQIRILQKQHELEKNNTSVLSNLFGDIKKKIFDAADITALASGLLTDSPAAMIAVKYGMDMIKSAREKAKMAKEEAIKKEEEFRRDEENQALYQELLEESKRNNEKLTEEELWLKAKILKMQEENYQREKNFQETRLKMREKYIGELPEPMEHEGAISSSGTVNFADVKQFEHLDGAIKGQTIQFEKLSESNKMVGEKLDNLDETMKDGVQLDKKVISEKEQENSTSELQTAEESREDELPDKKDFKKAGKKTGIGIKDAIISRVTGLIAVADHTIGGLIDKGFSTVGKGISGIGKKIFPNFFKKVKGLEKVSGKPGKKGESLFERLFGSISRGIAKFGESKILKGAASMALVGVSLVLVGKSFLIFQKAGLKGALIAAGALTALSLTLKFIGGIAGDLIKGALALAIVSGSLILTGVGFLIFSQVDWGSVFLGLLALSTFAAIAGIIGAPPIIGFILLGALGITALGVAAGVAGLGLLVLGTAMSLIFDSLQKLFTMLVETGPMGAVTLAAFGLAGLMAAPGIFALGTASLFAAPGLLLLTGILTLMTLAEDGINVFLKLADPMIGLGLIALSYGLFAAIPAMLAFSAALIAFNAALWWSGDAIENLISLGAAGEGMMKGAKGLKMYNEMIDAFDIDKANSVAESLAAIARAGTWLGIASTLFGFDLTTSEGGGRGEQIQRVVIEGTTMSLPVKILEDETERAISESSSMENMAQSIRESLEGNKSKEEQVFAQQNIFEGSNQSTTIFTDTILRNNDDTFTVLSRKQIAGALI